MSFFWLCEEAQCVYLRLHLGWKLKKRILKAAREKQEVTCKGAPITLAADVSMEILQARREWQEIFQLMKSKGL